MLAVRPFAGGGFVPSDASEGKKRPRELISRGACNCKGGGAPTTAGKKEQFLASKPPRPKPVDDAGAGCTPSVKRRKVSALVEQKQIPAPRMSREERNQLTRLLSSLSGTVPGYIGEFLQKQFGDTDAHECEIEINMDAVEDSVLFELKTRLDKFAEESKNSKVAVESKGDNKLAEKSNKDKKLVEESKDGKVTEESKDKKLAVENKDDKVTDTSEESPSEPAPALVSAEEKKAQAVKHAAARAIYMPGLIYRANLRRELLEMERALALLPPAESTVHPRELQRLCIAEYGRPSVIRHIGLVLRADA